MADNDIYVFSEKPGLLAELIAGARGLAGQRGGRVVAVCLGTRAQAEQAGQRGADGLMWLGELPPDRLVDDYLPTLAGLVERDSPFLVMIGATRRGRALAGRLAARLGVTALSDVLGFDLQSGDLRIRHMIFGGGAVREERPLAGPAVATVGPGVFEALPAGSSSALDPGEPVPFVSPPWQARLRERKQRPPAAVNLAAARRVVCPGRGVAKQEDLAMVEELAQLLRAELACTRPLAEGLGWLPRERYIGISGANLRADLYVGVGVSGQVQHLIGMNRTRVVVAINKDGSAPIFANADYGVVGDLYAVVPALIAALKERSGA